MRSLSVSPSTYSKTMYGVPSSSPASMTPTMCGWLSCATASRLAPEPLELVGVRGDLAVHQLDRDLALEDRVEGAIDRRHPARADLRVQPIAAVEQGADLRAHVSIVLREEAMSRTLLHRGRGSPTPAAYPSRPEVHADRPSGWGGDRRGRFTAAAAGRSAGPGWPAPASPCRPAAGSGSWSA